MIIGISKPNFDTIMRNDKLNLPKNWDGNDFHDSLSSLYEEYHLSLSAWIRPTEVKNIMSISQGILNAVESYHNGFPNKAFHHIDSVLTRLIENPLNIYRKSGWTNPFRKRDPLMLFRIRKVDKEDSYSRKDIFHTPYNFRSKISTCRYSIAGYPCLYLGTSLDLCCKEIKADSLDSITIASRYRIIRNMQRNGERAIDVIELGIKPTDFLTFNHHYPSDWNNGDIINRRRILNEVNLNSHEILSAYLLWYPLIAACSFIRKNKNDPFASEYIIPQLLMQWVRTQSLDGNLMGIRYFSCASEEASELGFNYVFPVSGEKDLLYNQYCRILSESFTLTNPVYFHEFASIRECERYLMGPLDFSKISVHKPLKGRL